LQSAECSAEWTISSRCHQPCTNLRQLGMECSYQQDRTHWTGHHFFSLSKCETALCGSGTAEAESSCNLLFHGDGCSSAQSPASGSCRESDCDRPRIFSLPFSMSTSSHHHAAALCMVIEHRSQNRIYFDAPSSFLADKSNRHHNFHCIQMWKDPLSHRTFQQDIVFFSQARNSGREGRSFGTISSGCEYFHHPRCNIPSKLWLAAMPLYPNQADSTPTWDAQRCNRNRAEWRGRIHVDR